MLIAISITVSILALVAVFVLYRASDRYEIGNALVFIVLGSALAVLVGILVGTDLLASDYSPISIIPLCTNTGLMLSVTLWLAGEIFSSQERIGAIEYEQLEKWRRDVVRLDRIIEPLLLADRVLMFEFDRIKELVTFEWLREQVLDSRNKPTLQNKNISDLSSRELERVNDKLRSQIVKNKYERRIQVVRDRAQQRSKGMPCDS